MSNLGRLEPVDLRTIWLSESGDFTPWLAQEENLVLLGNTIGLELELDSTEKNVGPFRADIVCKDTATDSWVLVENQLERTDHSHLGQLLTYAAGLDAVTIVWIAKSFTDEHRAALDWLNDVTERDLNFFGIEIELWQIGDSSTAPKFNLVSKPNDWTKTISQVRTSGELSETQQLQLEYWQTLRDYLHKSDSSLKSQKPFPQHWTDFAIGRSYFHITAAMNTRDKQLSIALIITGSDAKPHFHLLHQEKDAIESEIGYQLRWRELPNNKSSDIGINRSFDPTDRSEWPKQHAWLKEQLEAFYRVFSSRVKTLNAEDYVAADDIINDADGVE